MMEWIRRAAVAGTFYPKESEELIRMVESLLSRPPETLESPIAVMVPHAGYRYSGKIAAEVYKRISIPDTVILLCPNHTGHGARVSVWGQGSWLTPIGEARVDEDLAVRLVESLPNAQCEREAHRLEHANEVHVPFLLYLKKNVRIVPITLGGLTLAQCLELGERLGDVVKQRPKGSILLVASTDMSHFIPANKAHQQDELALAQVRRLSPESLYETVCEHEISMCGFIPTTVVLQAAKRLGATTSTVLGYAHSGEVTGDHRSVVGYSNAIIQ